jgi:hypothetical protein
MPMMTRKNESELNIRTFRFDSTSESDNSEETFPPTFGKSFLAISFETEVLLEDSKDIFKLSSVLQCFIYISDVLNNFSKVFFFL